MLDAGCHVQRSRLPLIARRTLACSSLSDARRSVDLQGYCEIDMVRLTKMPLRSLGTCIRLTFAAMLRMFRYGRSGVCDAKGAC